MQPQKQEPYVKVFRFQGLLDPYSRVSGLFSAFLQQNQIMDKKSDLGSSIYFSDKAGSITSQKSNKPKVRQTTYKIQVVNQNLEDAIKQIKTNVKENPEWNLNVKQVSKKYNKKKEPMAIISEVQQERPGTGFLPQSKRQPQPISLQPCRKINFQQLKFTERKKIQYLERLKSIKEKRMQLEVLSLQKQMRAKLERKVKQNMQLKQKAKIIQDIQERRQDKMRISDHQQFRKRQEQSLLHESNLAKVEMLRKTKRKSKKRQMSENMSRSQESKLDHKFREFLIDKEKKERKELLVTRYRMIKSASQGQFRTRSQARTIQTSQSNKHLKESNVVYI